MKHISVRIYRFIGTYIFFFKCVPCAARYQNTSKFL